MKWQNILKQNIKAKKLFRFTNKFKVFFSRIVIKIYEIIVSLSFIISSLLAAFNYSRSQSDVNLIIILLLILKRIYLV
jgi:hypothetical protein